MWFPLGDDLLVLLEGCFVIGTALDGGTHLKYDLKLPFRLLNHMADDGSGSDSARDP